MKVSHLLQMILLAVSIIHTGSQSKVASRQQKFIKREGFRNTGGIIASFLADSVISCSTACVSECECNSFNLGPVAVGTNNRKLCDLVETDQKSAANITEAPGWSLYLRKYHVVYLAVEHLF